MFLRFKKVLSLILQIIQADSHFNLLCLKKGQKKGEKREHADRSLMAFRGCVWSIHDTVMLNPQKPAERGRGL